MRESLALVGLSPPLTPSDSLWTNTGFPQGLHSSQLGWGVEEVASDVLVVSLGL